MSNDVKQSLEQINEISRQLLSRILLVQNTIQNSTLSHDTVIPKANSGAPTNASPIKANEVTDNEMTLLMSKRELLITHLFEHNSPEEIAVEVNLFNEMISVDNELSNNSQACKQALAEQIIRLKKSNKVTQSYQSHTKNHK